MTKKKYIVSSGQIMNFVVTDALDITSACIYAIQDNPGKKLAMLMEVKESGMPNDDPNIVYASTEKVLKKAGISYEKQDK